MCYTWEILRISCTQAFHVTYCYYYFIVLPRPYSPPQSDGEFFASYFIKTPSAESYTFLLAWLLFTCTLFTSMQKPFAGYQQSLSSGPTKFKHFSANASSSCYMQYRILLNFLFEIPTGSQTTPFETVRYPVALTYPPNSRSFNTCPMSLIAVVGKESYLPFAPFLSIYLNIPLAFSFLHILLVLSNYSCNMPIPGSIASLINL